MLISDLAGTSFLILRDQSVNLLIHFVLDDFSLSSFFFSYHSWNLSHQKANTRCKQDHKSEWFKASIFQTHECQNSIHCQSPLLSSKASLSSSQPAVSCVWFLSQSRWLYLDLCQSLIAGQNDGGCIYVTHGTQWVQNSHFWQADLE
jgi:hypothetical protein